MCQHCGLCGPGNGAICGALRGSTTTCRRRRLQTVTIVFKLLFFKAVHLYICSHVRVASVLSFWMVPSCTRDWFLLARYSCELIRIIRSPVIHQQIIRWDNHRWGTVHSSNRVPQGPDVGWSMMKHKSERETISFIMMSLPARRSQEPFEDPLIGIMQSQKQPSLLQSLSGCLCPSFSHPFSFFFTPPLPPRVTLPLLRSISLSLLHCLMEPSLASCWAFLPATDWRLSLEISSVLDTYATTLVTRLVTRRLLTGPTSVIAYVIPFYVNIWCASLLTRIFSACACARMYNTGVMSQICSFAWTERRRLIGKTPPAFESTEAAQVPAWRHLTCTESSGLHL